MFLIHNTIYCEYIFFVNIVKYFGERRIFDRFINLAYARVTVFSSFRVERGASLGMATLVRTIR